MDTLERELKLVPLSPDMLDQLAHVERLGPFQVQARRREQQTNAFFDSAQHGLQRARVGFRRRVVEGQAMATWTIKGDAQHLGGVATRSEIELQLDAHMPPSLALGALRDAARSRGAQALAEAVSEALANAGLPLAQPFLETRTDRTIVDLHAQDSQVELALDRMRIVGHAYSEIEIEVELKGGDVEVLDAVRQAIEDLGEVRESEGSKLSRAVSHLERCDCR